MLSASKTLPGRAAPATALGRGQGPPPTGPHGPRPPASTSQCGLESDAAAWNPHWAVPLTQVGAS